MGDDRPPPFSGDLTVLLRAAAGGDREASADLLPRAYAELRRLAEASLRRLPPGQTLSATALVHEAYLRLVGTEDPGWQGRAHFFGAAAQAMRNILVDQARRKARLRHGGDRRRVPLETAPPGPDDGSALTMLDEAEEILAVDAAIDELRASHPRPGEVVMLSYFAGLTHAQIAELLDVTTRTVERDWRFARAWLRDRLNRGQGASDGG